METSSVQPRQQRLVDHCATAARCFMGAGACRLCCRGETPVAGPPRARRLTPEHYVASGCTCGPSEERLAHIYGRGGIGSTDSLHECCEYFDRSHSRPHARAVHTLRFRSKWWALGTTIVHRVPAPFFRLSSGRTCCRLLDNVGSGERISHNSQRTIFFTPGFTRPGVYDRHLRIHRIPVRNLAIFVPTARRCFHHTYLQSAYGLTASSRSLAWRSGHAYDYSSRGVGVVGTSTCPLNEN